LPARGGNLYQGRTRTLGHANEEGSAEGRTVVKRQGKETSQPHSELTAKRQGWGEVQGIAAIGQWLQQKVETIVSSDFTYQNPRSYPDKILEVLARLACELLILRAKRLDRAVACCRSGVHLGPRVLSLSVTNHGYDDVHDLSVYERLCAASLSAGLKYMFPSQIDLEMPQEAYENWCNTIHWKWKFHDQKEDFEPELLLRSKDLAPVAPQFIENGLTQGRRTLQSMLQKLEYTSSPHPKVLKSVDNDKLVDLLTRFNLPCLPSNKNLEVALVRKDWFIEQSVAHLSNPNSYRKISQVEEFKLHRDQERNVKTLVAHPYVKPPT
jgi:hypothetical protein